MTIRNSSKICEPSAVAKCEAGKPLLILPPQWCGLEMNIFPLPHCEERGPSHAEHPLLIFLLSGGGQHWFRHSVGVVESDTTPAGILLHGNDYQREWARWQGTPGHSVAIKFTPQVVNRLVKGMPDFDLVTTDEIFDPKIQWFVRELLEEAQRGAPGGALYAESLSCALIAYLARGYGNRQSYDQPAGGLSLINRGRVTDFIEAHLGEQLSITELAEEVGLSPHHFSRCFTVSFGQPPHRYVLQRRIEAARKMLMFSSRPIAEIAVDLGFYSHAHFTRVFREHSGMTPTRARAK